MSVEPLALASGAGRWYRGGCRMHARRRGRARDWTRSAAPKEQPPRKLSGKRTAGGRALWKAAGRTSNWAAHRRS